MITIKNAYSSTAGKYSDWELIFDGEKIAIDAEFDEGIGARCLHAVDGRVFVRCGDGWGLMATTWEKLLDLDEEESFDAKLFLKGKDYARA